MNTRVFVRAVVGVVSCAIVVSSAYAQPCVPAWSDQFSLSDFDNLVFDLSVHDDGSGPAVYASGIFTQAGNTHVNYLARLDGSDWYPVGEPFDEGPWSLAPCDDWPGLGPQLFAGGGFRHAGAVEMSSIARWDGTSWAPLGAGVSISGKHYSYVFSTAFVRDAFGQGPALFVGGAFDTAGTAPALNVARWDGKGWSALGSGLEGTVYALTWFDDGGGAALYATGNVAIGSGQFTGVARWDGATWTPLATGFDFSASTMVVYDDGRGSALFVGGYVLVEEASHPGIVTRWDGVTWTQVGDTFDQSVSELGVFDVGGGPVLGASGPFEQVGKTDASHIATWDCVSWSPLGAGISSVAYGMVSIPGEAGMYAGGLFQIAGDTEVGRFARWDGSTWSPIGNGVTGMNGGSVLALEVFDDGSGPDLYVGGYFVSAGGMPAASIMRWDGTHGTTVSGGTDGFVLAMQVVADPGIGPGLYVAGQFDHAGQTAAISIARWDGTTWSALAGGVSGIVHALRVFDDGTGPALFVGGRFLEAGGIAARNIARWDGQQWAAVGQGLPGDGDDFDSVKALAVFDDRSGAGSILYAGGYFLQQDHVTNGLARLDGDRWQSVGEGIAGSVRAMKVFDDGTGSGPALFVGGSYCILPDGVSCNLARWNGSTWSNIPMPESTIRSLDVYDDGTGLGPRLYVGGWLQDFAGTALAHIAAWDGETWTPLASGVGQPNNSSSSVIAMAVFDDGLGDGDALYMGGVFETAGDLLSNNIARWGGCGSFVLGDLTGDGVVGLDDIEVLFDNWGSCVECSACPADLDGDCAVGIRDFLILLANWGP